MDALQAIYERRSCRCFLPQQVDERQLTTVLAAGTYAPTGMGRQSPKIIVLQKREDIDLLERMNAAIMGQPDAHPFYGAPTVCVVLADAGEHTAVEDGSLVLGNLMLAAEAVGLGSCWIHRAREEFTTPEGQALLQKWGVAGNYIGVGHCLLGYPAAAPNPRVSRKPDYIVRP